MEFTLDGLFRQELVKQPIQNYLYLLWQCHMGASLKTELHKKVFLTWGSSGMEAFLKRAERVFFCGFLTDEIRQNPLAGQTTDWQASTRFGCAFSEMHPSIFVLLHGKIKMIKFQAEECWVDTSTIQFSVLVQAKEYAIILLALTLALTRKVLANG